MTDVMKEKLNHLVEGYTKIVNQNSFRVLSILYITNFCETRKIIQNSSTFFSSKCLENYEVRTKLGNSKLSFKEDTH